jgi:hypothetical protein
MKGNERKDESLRDFLNEQRQGALPLKPRSLFAPLKRGGRERQPLNLYRGSAPDPALAVKQKAGILIPPFVRKCGRSVPSRDG